MVSYLKRNMGGLGPINEKDRLLPPPPLMRLRHQGTGLSFNFKIIAPLVVQTLIYSV
jgi:hypothetical protein